MHEIHLSAGQLISALLAISETEKVCFLDSCGISNLGSHFLIAGINPLETLEISNADAAAALAIFERKIAENFACVFTISYEFGLKLNKIKPRRKEFPAASEPDIFLAVFDHLIIHDYDTKQTYFTGNTEKFDDINSKLLAFSTKFDASPNVRESIIESNFTRAEYIGKIEEIKELIRLGKTYQTNLTQQFRVRLPENLTPQKIFYKLRKNNPAPFAAFLRREKDYVVSISPERFFKVENGKWRVENEEKYALRNPQSKIISTSPIKGTRRRGKTVEEDLKLRDELLNSAKDRAENVMIVDLLRNDLGRICKFGTVEVEKLCELEIHPTLFHLVSTISGKVRNETKIADIIRAVFPCGSITGAPKISTMKIIDRLETANRGLSMGAIGFSMESGKWKMGNSENSIFHFPLSTFHSSLDLSVAIRTMTIKDNCAVFNVGGGVVIDSVAEDEYEETLTKAEALLNAVNANFK